VRGEYSRPDITAAEPVRACSEVLSCPTKRGARMTSDGPSKPYPSSELMKAYLENQGLQHAQEYVKRGRQLKAEPTDVLKERWAELFRRMATNWPLSKPDDAMRADIEAELRFRNEELPFEAVQAEKDALIALATKTFENLQNDPQQFADVNADLEADLREFEVDIGAKKKS
jgi:hypothetical protein